MTQYLATELAGSANQTSIPTGYRPKASVQGGRMKRLRASISLAAQQTTDTILLGYMAPDSVFAFGMLNTDTSLGSSTLSIGDGTTANRFANALTDTSVNTPVLFASEAIEAMSDYGVGSMVPVTLTIGGAALPASGNLVIDLYYSRA
jgi:hypothetical protein